MILNAAHVAGPKTPETAAAHVLGAAFFMLGFICYDAPLGAAAALPVCAALTVWLAIAENIQWSGSPLRIHLIFAPLLSFMLLSSLWAIDGEAALLLGVRLAGLLICTLVMCQILSAIRAKRRRLLLIYLALGLALSSAVTAADLMTGSHLAIALHHLHDPAYGPNAYSRGSVFQAIIVGSVVVALWTGGKRSLAIVTILAATAAIMLGSQWSAKLALLIAAGVFATVTIKPSLRWAVPSLMLAVSAILPFFFPSVPPAWLTCWMADHKPSALHRTYIWDFVASRIHEKPFLGWGLDAARRIPGGQTLVPIRSCSAPDAVPAMGQLLPLHPHNGILQVWLELGGVGALLLFGTLAVVLYRALAARPLGGKTALAMRAATAAAILSVAVFSFGVWQEWWLSCVALAVAATALATPASGAQGWKALPVGLAEPEAGSA